MKEMSDGGAENIKKIKTLIEEGKKDLGCYKSEWQERAVWALNEYYIEHEPDNEIYDLNGDLWEDLVKYELETRSWQGLLFFLGKLEPMDNWARLDGYGNATRVSGDDLLGMLEDMLEEMGAE